VESDRILSPRSLSVPRSPEYVGGDETVVLQTDMDEDLSGNERRMKFTRQLGPKTPPGSDDEDDDRKVF
jgi:hypothetical protein